MATNAPYQKCFICGQPIEYEAVQQHREPWQPTIYGPTDWRPIPHECPPGAGEAWVKKMFEQKGPTDE